MDNRRTLGIEAQNLKLMWQHVVSQFTSDLYGHHIDRKQAERSYDRFEVAVEQFMRDATANSTSSATGSSAHSSAIPTCPEFPRANELCS
jgi:hypothetical protein